MPHAVLQRRVRKRVPRNRTHVHSGPQTTSDRTLSWSKEILLTGWQNSGSSHLRSAPIDLEFVPTNFPGFAALQDVFDQVRFNMVRWLLVLQTAQGSTKVVRPRTMTILSTYDPDGGLMNATDVLSRNNLRIRTLHAANPETSLSGVPGTVAPDTRVVFKQHFHDAGGVSSLLFNSHKIVADIITGDMTPSDALSLKAYCTCSMTFKGLR